MGRVACALVLALLIPSVVLPMAAGVSSSGGVERRLVSFRDAVPSGSFHGLPVVESFPFARVAVLEGPLADLLALEALPGVAGVYEDEPLTLLLDRVRGIDRADPPPGNGSWPTGEGVTIALVDSGIDATHPGLAGRVAAQVRVERDGDVVASSGDGEGHGTHVAGILAGSGAASEGKRLRGLAPGARLVGVDISDSFTTTTAVRAFQWIHDHRAEHGIRVVSNSWGREKADAHYDPDDPVIRASDALVADGLVVVFSAGNRGREGEATLTTEATNPNVLTVGAASATGRAEAYSSRGPARDGDGRALPGTKPDLVAPGTAVLSARTSAHRPAGGSEESRFYTVMNGTSMAAPQVAAAAALLLDAHPHLSPGMIAALLTGTARDLGAAGPDAATGAGQLDVRAALEAADRMGEARRVVHTVQRLPVHVEGTVAAAAGLVVLVGGAPQVPPAQSVAIPLVLPPGTSAVDLAFTWSGAGDFAARLEGEGASFDLVPEGQRRLVLGAHPAPGAYRLVAHPTGVATNTPFVLEGHVAVERTTVLDAPPEFQPRPLNAEGGFFAPAGGGVRLLGLAGIAPALLASLAALAACAVVACRRA